MVAVEARIAQGGRFFSESEKGRQNYGVHYSAENPQNNNKNRKTQATHSSVSPA